MKLFKFRVNLLSILFSLLIVPAALFANGQAEAAGQEDRSTDTTTAQELYPISVVDGMGNELEIDQAPQHIASLTLFTDELLFDLVSIDRIAAITFLASDPVFSNIADRADEVSMQLDLNVEELINIYPDLIFAANWSDAGKVEQLKNAGLNVYLINTPTDIDGIKAEILKIGMILAEEEKASAIVTEMTETISEVESILADLQQKMTGLDYSNWGTVSGSTTSWNAILEAAGLINAASDYEVDDFGQVALSKEALVELDPDIIFLPGWIWGDPGAAEAFENEVKNDPALSDLKAVKEDRIYLVPEYVKGTFSQYIAESVRFVASLAYSQYFNE